MISQTGGAAAFFDLDGTLAPLPSLEWRLFRSLRNQGLVPAANYLAWLGATLRLFATRGASAARHENKLYLRGLSARDLALYCEQEVRLAEPLFFAPAMERLLGHAFEGHAIVIVSGTFLPLACVTVRLLESAMHARGANTRVLLRCTHLEERHGRCTGRVIGQAMCGLAKASAVRRLANQQGWDLARCFAYGDSAGDRCMLSCVGHPAAVNPSPALRCIARRRGWPVVVWRGESPSDARGLVERSQARLKTPLEMR